MQIIKLPVVAFVIMFIHTGCDLNNTANKSSIEQITRDAETSLLTMQTGVDEAEGYFKDEGLNIVIKPLDSGSSCLEQMLMGTEIDSATVTEAACTVNNSFTNIVVISSISQLKSRKG